ncbi:unnamed protein product [Miscanthus lutarioriparius]|uniref:Condensin-2 complex subunit H2 n=1 Tax=Miscanthus lutarioriparius TaxID=422564 RepID=A0A811NJL1_9POAL|nr:unnamed protein product [Miscanthus lutarioriparius]
MDGGDGEVGSTGGRFPILQANRDPESNWEVDVAKSLEEYLLKICSGEVSGEDGPTLSTLPKVRWCGGLGFLVVNVRHFFSAGVISVGVWRAGNWECEDQLENGSAQANQNDPSTIPSEEDDIFMGLDDVPVETRTSLDNNVNRDDLQRKIVRPPANLLVFEGDYLDSEASELDTYLLATCDFYGDFLLLDPCDAPAVFDFLQGKHSGKENSVAHQGSSAPSKSRANVFTSPNLRSAGTDDIEDPVGDYSDDEDPWKPLNPHEPGNLKIRPYRRVKGSPRGVIGTSKKKTLTFLFPMAKMDGAVIPEHAKSFKAQQSQQEEHYGSQSPPRFEKFLRSFEFGEENPNVFGHLKDDNGSNTGINFDDDDLDMPNDIDVDPDVPTYPDETIAATPNGTQDDIDTHASLDDLCRSHLNALLASIAEVEKQSEMDARVSTWKERIEEALEEQDKNPPFDIGSYGEQILDTLSSRTDNTGTASFSEIVSGRPKYEVARTFSALLQLVNGRSVDLDKGQAMNELVCYTAEDPFHVRLIGPNRRPEMEARFARKRVKSPLQNAGKGGESSLAQHECSKKPLHKNGKIPVKTAIRLTPDGKRRRRSAAHLMQPINLESSG